MDFRDSQTYQNLLNAYGRELTNSAKYQIFEEKAINDEYIQVGNIFGRIAENEREHAILWRNFLNESVVPTTLENLEEARAIEEYEWTELYVDFAKTARDEGYDEIARLFDWVAKIEQHHDFIFSRLAQNIRDNQMFCKESRVVWICIKCGNLIFDTCAPDICPVCFYPQGYYELNCDNI